MDSQAIINAVNGVTKKWAKQRKAEERHAQARERRDYVMTRRYRLTTRDVAFDAMEEAYLKASSGGTLPAHARQIMYAARGRIQEETGNKLNDQYFCQTLLPDYMARYPDKTAGWDVVFDARGHFTEPHTEKTVALGTLDVRKYLAKVGEPATESAEFTAAKFKTHGPSHRYGAILFIEKEGFMPLFEEVELADRFDIAIMSTKGMSNVASRRLVDRLCSEYRIPLLVAHDFDKAGFSILGTLQRDTRRYEFENSIQVIDLGLRLSDVEQFSLASEDVYYRMESYSLRQNLRKNGADDEEIDFLTSQRVELNAFSSGDLIEWLESKFEEHGIEKVIPAPERLAEAYRHTIEARYIEEKADALLDEAGEYAKAQPAPDNLADLVAAKMAETDSLAWDDAIRDVAADLDEEEEA